MKRIFLLASALFCLASIWAIKPEKEVVEALRYGMSPAQVREICDAEKAQQYAKKIQTRLMLFECYTTEVGLIAEYKMQFVDEKLVACCKRNGKYDGWVHVNIKGEDPIAKLLSDSAISYASALFDAEDALIVGNYTREPGRYKVLILSSTQHWLYMGMTKQMACGEDFRFTLDLTDYPQFEAPIQRVAVLADNGKTYAISASKSGDDVRIGITDEDVAAQQASESTHVVSSTPEQPTSNAQDIKARMLALKDLFDSGIITEEEYNAKRKQLLDSL